MRSDKNKHGTSIPAQHQLIDMVRSRLFFVATLLLFFIQATWIAISNKFPMAYDESYHFGIIKLYAHQWSPFFAHQPAGGDSFGALTSYPSYLFHYLMSFPYRVFHAMVPNFGANIIFLRLIDVALFAVGIVLFRQVLLKARLPRAMVHTLLFCLALLPMVPFLAATINYDNLLFPLTALALLLGLNWAQRLHDTGNFDIVKSLQLLAVCCFASLTKYTFLPIFVGIALFVASYNWYTKRHSSFRFVFRLSRWAGIALVAITLLGTGLFVERYGYNTLRYHTPVPQCDKVLSVASCSAYGTWDRNYQLAQRHVTERSLPQMLRFDRAWVHLLAGGTFAVVNTNHGVIMPAIPYVMVSGLLIVAIGSVLAVVHYRRFVKFGAVAGLFTCVSLCYVGALWLQNYADFSHLGLPIGVQARYLVPVLPLLLIVPCLGYTAAFQERRHFSIAVAATAMGVLLLGGGVMTYVLRSDNSWYWHSGVVARTNTTIRQAYEHTWVAGLYRSPN